VDGSQNKTQYQKSDQSDEENIQLIKSGLLAAFRLAQQMQSKGCGIN
jgi:hypothetical protein